MPMASRAINPLAGVPDLTPPRPLSRTALGTADTPDVASDFPHYCPICMMHFKRILVTSCCSNNLCEVCSTELIEQHAAKAPLQRALRRTTAYKEQQQQQQSSAARTGIYLPDCAEPEPGVFDPMVPMSCPFCTRSLTLRAVQQPTRGGATSVASTPSHPHRSVDYEPAPTRSYVDSPAVVKAVNGSGSTTATPIASARGPLPSTPNNSTNNSGALLHLTPAAIALRPPTAGQKPNSSGMPLRVPAAAVPMYSPVKTGDEFEALRRKLRPLDKIDPNSAVGKEHVRREEERDRLSKLHQQQQQQQQQQGGRPPLRPPSGAAGGGGSGAARTTRIVAGDGSVIVSSSSGRVPTSSSAAAGGASGAQRSRFPPQQRSSSSGASRQTATAPGDTEAVRSGSPKKKESGFSCLVM